MSNEDLIKLLNSSFKDYYYLESTRILETTKVKVIKCNLFDGDITYRKEKQINHIMPYTLNFN